MFYICRYCRHWIYYNPPISTSSRKCILLLYFIMYNCNALVGGFHGRTIKSNRCTICYVITAKSVEDNEEMFSWWHWCIQIKLENPFRQCFEFCVSVLCHAYRVAHWMNGTGSHSLCKRLNSVSAVVFFDVSDMFYATCCTELLFAHSELHNFWQR